MKKFYTQSIAVFSIVIPLVITVILLFVISSVKSAKIGDFASNQAIYQRELAQKSQLQKLQQQSKTKEQNLKQWNKLLKESDFTKVNDLLRDSIKKHNKTGTLQLTEQDRAQRTNLGVKAKYSACEFAFQGTFAELQLCLTELECRMPNLMLNDMKLSPQRRGNLLNLKIKYTIWEK